MDMSLHKCLYFSHPHTVLVKLVSVNSYIDTPDRDFTIHVIKPFRSVKELPLSDVLRTQSRCTTSDIARVILLMLTNPPGVVPPLVHNFPSVTGILPVLPFPIGTGSYVAIPSNCPWQILWIRPHKLSTCCSTSF